MINNIHKNKKLHKVFRYGIVGAGTTLVNIVVYQLLIYVGIEYMISNLVAIISSKLFAYITNKIYVFKSKTENFIELAKEFWRYLLARGFTGIIDYVGLIILIEIIKIDEVLSKYIITILVIILNYIFGNKYIFKNQGDK